MKDVRTKPQKIDPSPLVRKISALAQPPFPLVWHTINFKISDAFCTKKCGRPHLKKPPLSAKCLHYTNTNPLPLTVDVFLWTPLKQSASKVDFVTLQYFHEAARLHIVFYEI